MTTNGGFRLPCVNDRSTGCPPSLQLAPIGIHRSASLVAVPMGRKALGPLPTSHGAFTATQVRSNFLPRIETIRRRPAWIRRRRRFCGPGGQIVFTCHASRGNTLARRRTPLKSFRCVFSMRSEAANPIVTVVVRCGTCCLPLNFHHETIGPWSSSAARRRSFQQWTASSRPVAPPACFACRQVRRKSLIGEGGTSWS
jgi:hypothetical protein